jgi:hypothetical protein
MKTYNFYPITSKDVDLFYFNTFVWFGSDQTIFGLLPVWKQTSQHTGLLKSAQSTKNRFVHPSRPFVRGGVLEYLASLKPPRQVS